MTVKASHWAKQQERGNRFFLTLTRVIVKYCPLWLIRLITFGVVVYFWATSKKMRGYICQYQQYLHRTFPYVKLPKWAVFRQFLAFGESITDCFSVWQRKIRYTDLMIDDPDNLYAEMEQKNQRGQLLICSHFGNVEICRALVNQGHHRHFKLNILVHSRHAEEFNRALIQAGADDLCLIQVENLDAAKMLELQQCIERGEWIALAGDRIPVKGHKTLPVNFLGKEAEFPQGAWLLASLLKTPINTVFCVKKCGQYHLILRKFHCNLTGAGKLRQQRIATSMQDYADLLAQQCVQNPLMWFNFYDFWAKKTNSYQS